MKTRVITLLSSGITEVTHTNISVIPEVVKFYSEEEYIIGDDITLEKLYSRMSYDLNSYFEITYDYNQIEKTFDKALENNDRIFFIYDYIDELIINKLKEKYNEKLLLYKAKSFGYVIVNIALEAERLFNKEKHRDYTVINALDYIDNNSYSILYSPKEDILVSDYRYNGGLIENNERGIVRIFNGENVLEIKDKKTHPLNIMSKKLLELVNEDSTPFLMYSNPDSYYTDLLDQILNLAFPKVKNIKKIYVPLRIAKMYGFNSVIFGVIRKEK